MPVSFMGTKSFWNAIKHCHLTQAVQEHGQGNIRRAYTLTKL